MLDSTAIGRSQCRLRLTLLLKLIGPLVFLLNAGSALAQSCGSYGYDGVTTPATTVQFYPTPNAACAASDYVSCIGS